MGIFGGDVSFTLVTTHYMGITAAAMNVLFAPIITIIMGILFALFSFLPFTLFLKAIGGIRLQINTAEQV